MDREGDYYSRRFVEHVDGTRIFQSDGDRKNEQEIASVIEAAWRCSVRSFGALSPIDWYAVRDGRVTALLELKSRTHSSGQYPTVFLNVRKWLAMSLGACGMGIPAIFVVRFTDCVMWVPIAKVDAHAHRIAGCSSLVKSVNDIEPIIEVPIKSMSVLHKEPGHGQEITG